MQDLMQNRNLLVALVLVVVGAIVYFGFFSGGLSRGDLPTELSSYQAPPSTGAAPGAPSGPPAAAPAKPAKGQPPSLGTNVESPSGPPTPPPAPVAKPAAEKPTRKPVGRGINEKLLAFRQLDPDSIIDKKYDDLEKKVSKPEAFAPDIGRVDPLTVVLDFIPEELRPPREGETSEEEILKFIQEAIGYEMIDSIKIEVQEVIELGNYSVVLLAIDGQSTSAGVGDSMYDNGVTITILSADRDTVVCNLMVRGQYSTVSKNRTFIARKS